MRTVRKWYARKMKGSNWSIKAYILCAGTVDVVLSDPSLEQYGYNYVVYTTRGAQVLATVNREEKRNACGQ